MLKFDEGSKRFNFRSAAIFIHSDHLLIHKLKSDDYWCLPGGRVEFFETSEQTISREIKEELGVECKVNRLVWYVENFFYCNSKRYHEIANYFLSEFDKTPIIDSEMDFPGIEKEIDLIFRWVPLTKLSDYNLRPNFLIDGVKNMPASIEYLKNNELEDQFLTI